MGHILSLFTFIGWPKYRLQPNYWCQPRYWCTHVEVESKWDGACHSVITWCCGWSYNHAHTVPHRYRVFCWCCDCAWHPGSPRIKCTCLSHVNRGHALTTMISLLGPSCKQACSVHLGCLWHEGFAESPCCQALPWPIQWALHRCIPSLPLVTLGCPGLRKWSTPGIHFMKKHCEHHTSLLGLVELRVCRMQLWMAKQRDQPICLDNGAVPSSGEALQ